MLLTRCSIPYWSTRYWRPQFDARDFGQVRRVTAHIGPLLSQDSNVAIDAEIVASRAEGRPAEEGSSDNPEAQAQVILEESEQRIVDGAHASDPVDELILKASDDQLEDEGAG